MSDETRTEHSHEAHGDTFTVPWIGATMTLPGGLYTFIFGLLAILTLIEVGLTFLEENALIVAVLIFLSLTKAFLVVTFYMHLRNDNPLFRVVLIIPLLVVIASVAYLLFVPSGPGLGYN